MDQAMLKNAWDLFVRVVTQHYMDFNGRVSRKEYWTYAAVVLGVAIIVAVVGTILGLRILSTVLMLALILPNTGMTVRRLHDVGKDGTIVLICAGLLVLLNLLTLTSVALIGPVFAFLAFGGLAYLVLLATLGLGLYILFLCTQPGQTGPNQYGPPVG